MIRIAIRNAVLIAAPTLMLAGCYVVPVAPDGTPVAVYPPGAPVAVAPPPAARVPAVLTARLYPANDAAAQTGVLAGTVSNTMDGRGRFQLEFRGEILNGEATRVQGDAIRGVANAYGDHGTWMSCEYRMRTPYQGAGACTMSTGEKYSVHLGG